MELINHLCAVTTRGRVSLATASPWTLGKSWARAWSMPGLTGRCACASVRKDGHKAGLGPSNSTEPAVFCSCVLVLPASLRDCSELSCACSLKRIPPSGKIRLIEGNAKCRHPKKLACQGTLRQVFICLRPRTPYHPPPPPITHCKRVYITVYLILQGRGGRRESWTREKWRGATVHKAGSKIPTWLTVSMYLTVSLVCCIDV
jgi:hypothetical protein